MKRVGRPCTVLTIEFYIRGIDVLLSYCNVRMTANTVPASQLHSTLRGLLPRLSRYLKCHFQLACYDIDAVEQRRKTPQGCAWISMVLVGMCYIH